MVAFAFMFATTMSVVAQEKVASQQIAAITANASVDKSDQDMSHHNTKFVRHKVENKSVSIVSMENAKVLEDPNAVWFRLMEGITPNETNAKDHTKYEPAPGNQPPCSGNSVYCGVKATNNGSNQPVLGSTTQAYTAIDNYFNGAGTDTNLISEQN